MMINLEKEISHAAFSKVKNNFESFIGESEKIATGEELDWAYFRLATQLPGQLHFQGVALTMRLIKKQISPEGNNQSKETQNNSHSREGGNPPSLIRKDTRVQENDKLPIVQNGSGKNESSVEIDFYKDLLSITIAILKNAGSDLDPKNGVSTLIDQSNTDNYIFLTRIICRVAHWLKHYAALFHQTLESQSNRDQVEFERDRKVIEEAI